MTTVTADQLTDRQIADLRQAYATGQTAAANRDRRPGEAAAPAMLPVDVNVSAALAAQVSRADLDGMTPAQIEEARQSGRLALLDVAPALFSQGYSGAKLGMASDAAASVGASQLTRADLAGMSAREIVEAQRAGRCSVLLGGQAGQSATGLDE